MGTSLGPHGRGAGRLPQAPYYSKTAAPCSVPAERLPAGIVMARIRERPQARTRGGMTPHRADS